MVQLRCDTHRIALKVSKLGVVAWRDDDRVMVWEGEELIDGIGAGLGTKPMTMQPATAFNPHTELIPGYVHGLSEKEGGMLHNILYFSAAGSKLQFPGMARECVFSPFSPVWNEYLKVSGKIL